MPVLRLPKIKNKKEKKRKKRQIIFKISPKIDNFLWYNSFESESMTIGSASPKKKKRQQDLGSTMTRLLLIF